jgi:hypothetical protein
MEPGGQQEDHKLPTSVTPCGEGTELIASTGQLLSWMPLSLLRNIIPKGNGKRFVSYSFVPSPGADSGESFAAILENRGKDLNLRQRSPILSSNPSGSTKGVWWVTLLTTSKSQWRLHKSPRCMQPLVPPMLPRKMSTLLEKSHQEFLFSRSR